MPGVHWWVAVSVCVGLATGCGRPEPGRMPEQGVSRVEAENTTSRVVGNASAEIVHEEHAAPKADGHAEAAPVEAAPAEVAPVEVRLSVPKRKYLLGEAVELNVKITNRMAEPIRFDTRGWVGLGPEDDFSVRIAYGPGEFKRYTAGLYPTACGVRLLEPLPPGASLEYSRRALVDDSEPKFLAFPVPGRYFLRAVYELRMIDPEGSRKSIACESNVVTIRVERPRGAEAEIWRKINSRAFLTFLQTGWSPSPRRKMASREPGDERRGEERAKLDGPDVMALAFQLFREHPTSEYADELRWALKSRYEAWLNVVWSEKEFIANETMAAVGRALGIEEPKPWGAFPEDRRLSLRLRHDGPPPATVQAFCEAASAQLDVPLSVHEDFARWYLTDRLRNVKTLRGFMDGWHAFRAKWIKDGHGYRLIPESLSASKARPER